MHRTVFAFLTLALGAGAFAASSQPPQAGTPQAGKECKVIERPAGQRSGQSSAVGSSSTVTAGPSGSLSSSTTTNANGVTVHSGGGSSSSAAVASSNGTTVVTGSGGECYVYVDPVQKKESKP